MILIFIFVAFWVAFFVLGNVIKVNKRINRGYKGYVILRYMILALCIFLTLGFLSAAATLIKDYKLSNENYDEFVKPLQIVLNEYPEVDKVVVGDMGEITIYVNENTGYMRQELMNNYIQGLAHDKNYISKNSHMTVKFNYNGEIVRTFVR